MVSQAEPNVMGGYGRRPFAVGDRVTITSSIPLSLWGKTGKILEDTKSGVGWIIELDDGGQTAWFEDHEIALVRRGA